ncbi:outer membrane immunogenic protein [Rhodoligotrophos appendicifer]|uniref:outer membrane protein n=1 Tax=Rhodoligotrophos appendicifer TaxID=987056 RepID=UPI0014783CEF|nr:outer membrane beta-barrel protein [Rhodoligotrophos appendicifer]
MYKQFKWAVFTAATAIVAPEPALAADLYSPPPAVIAVEPAVSWTGIYLGGSVGGAGSASATNTPLRTGKNARFNGSGSEGLIGGGFVGFNYQLSPQVVFGLQGDYFVPDLEATFGKEILPEKPGPKDAAGGALTRKPLRPQRGKPDRTESIRDLWSVSARAGWLPSESTMIYVLGGYSNADLKLKLSAGKGHTAIDGYHVGTGIETKLTDSLSARVEYRYVHLSGEKKFDGRTATFEPAIHMGTFGLAWTFTMF